mmetsp:Transcript_104824/g.338002  ORF Transcript_104824/g.338002 Transcript_104824/m.338002 type:complete len:245 (-) Transcript_104824:475-1209(-)
MARLGNATCRGSPLPYWRHRYLLPRRAPLRQGAAWRLHRRNGRQKVSAARARAGARAPCTCRGAPGHACGSGRQRSAAWHLWLRARVDPCWPPALQLASAALLRRWHLPRLPLAKWVRADRCPCGLRHAGGPPPKAGLDAGAKRSCCLQAQCRGVPRRYGRPPKWRAPGSRLQRRWPPIRWRLRAHARSRLHIRCASDSFLSPLCRGMARPQHPAGTVRLSRPLQLQRRQPHPLRLDRQSVASM